MNTQLPPESLESRIAPAAVSGLGDEFVGPAKTSALAAESPAEAAPAPITVDDSVGLPRSGNIDLGTVVHDIATVPVDTTDLSALSVAASEAVRGAASTLDVLATSALSGEVTGVGTLGIGDLGGAPSGIETKSALESSASNIADLVLIQTGGFVSANPESLLIVKV